MNQNPPLAIGVDEPTRKVSELLHKYIRAEDEAECDLFAAQLITGHAEPVARFVISYKLNLGAARLNSSPDADDILSEVTLEILEVLQELRANTGSPPIRDFRGYVATVAYRACSDYLRKKHPGRSRLKSKIRYLLARSKDVELWRNGRGEWLCGRPEYRLAASPAAAFSDVEAAAKCGETGLVALITGIFSRVGRPVHFNDLVSAVAGASGVVDDHENGTDILDRLPDLRASVETEVERRIHLQRVWAEITRLPPRQRAALLLGLTDSSGRGVTPLLPIAGIASLREIAAALEISDERLARLWNELPLEDARIADYLNITRQQVINLRKAARERLARRTKAFHAG